MPVGFASSKLTFFWRGADRPIKKKMNEKLTAEIIYSWDSTHSPHLDDPCADAAAGWFAARCGWRLILLLAALLPSLRFVDLLSRRVVLRGPTSFPALVFLS